ncbi:MAG: putative terminase large subunit [Prokaryotic dsDNA virus sp.]|nr:MAG: putative terminase large subunit [Prokaryotic dsDNA virus sp.]|tara:strand:+ start:4182 stop:5492 length:1311 start_codon:yes stop_codon:yes gene_type:complete
MTINLDFTPKQSTAIKYLFDNTNSEILFGGGAGGGKSYIGCAWIILSCIKYKGIRCLIGRSKLDNLKKTTLNTFFEICSQWGLKSNKDYVFNAGSNIITFYNGSEVLLKDLFHYPSDANYDSLGSLELTMAFVDECNQITQKAKAILSSRIRYKLDEYNLTPKLFMSCNPAKNWVYNEFYLPHKQDKLPKYRKFIQALASDNVHISKHYEQQLSKLDEISKQRLLYGNWEYDDSEDKLINFDAILNMFDNTSIEAGDKYISCDVARFGKDKTVIIYWNGLRAERIKVYSSNTITEAAKTIQEIQRQELVPLKNIIVDDDGIGGGVRDILRCKGFVNNATPINKENYQNLKTQCYYKLAEYINASKIYLHTNDTSIKEDLTKELEQVRRDKIDRDTKLAILPKEKVKQIIGRSPDYSDALMMRMYYELRPQGVYYVQ